MEIRTFVRDENGSETVQPNGRLEVQRYSWHVIGGPQYATIKVTEADTLSLWRLAEMLGYHVTLGDDQGRKVWWGYINDVVLHIQGRVLSVGLDDMTNHVIVHYADPQVAGTQAKTAAATNAVTIARYGTKELIYMASDLSTAAAAEGLRDQVLAQKYRPVIQRSIEGAAGADYAEIMCRGWWATLDWQYYANASTALVATSTQIANIITSAGQFFTGTEVYTASGITTSEARDGNEKAMQYVETLLKIGVSGGRRYMATATEDRRLVVQQEPAQYAADYRITVDGVLYDNYNVQVVDQLCPVGVWVADNSVLLPRQSETVSDPGGFFIESAEYNAVNYHLRIQPRGRIDPLDVVGIIDG